MYVKQKKTSVHFCCFEILIKFVAKRFINCKNHKLSTHKLKIKKNNSNNK